MTSPWAWRPSVQLRPSCARSWPNGRWPWSTCTRPQLDAMVSTHQTIIDSSRLAKAAPKMSTNHNASIQYDPYKYNPNKPSQGTKIQSLKLPVWHPYISFGIRASFVGVLSLPTGNRRPRSKPIPIIAPKTEDYWWDQRPFKLLWKRYT